MIPNNLISNVWKHFEFNTIDRKITDKGEFVFHFTNAIASSPVSLSTKAPGMNSPNLIKIKSFYFNK